MSSKKCVAVFFGGVSPEHEVSRVSASFVIENLSREKYDVLQIGITKKGDFLLYDGSTENIVNGQWEKDPFNKLVLFSLNRSDKGIVIKDGDNLKTVNVDVAFPVLHGENGEDGTIQGVFELSGIPFVGCDVTSSAVCMDKIMTNVLLTSSSIKKAKFVWTSKDKFKKDPESVIEKVKSELTSYPLFVKPSNAGSSVGISKVYKESELGDAIEKALEVDSRVLVEEGISGREVECAVLGNEDPVASVVGEIIPANDFYDYEAKYLSDQSKLFIPADISKDISDKIRDTAVKAYKVMGCSGLSRIDFFIKEKTNEVLLNEINTMPGFTSISMYPKLFEATGVPCEDLLEKLIDFAIERHQKNE